MEIRISGKKIFWGIVIIVIIAAAVAWTWVTVAAMQSPDGPSPYSAVYLTSGDIYFGKLSWFPEPHMTDVWYLDRSVDSSGQTQVSIAPFQGAFWGPMDEVTLNPQQILFWTSISKSSQLVADLNNPSLLQQQSQGQSPASASSTPSTLPGSATSSSAPAGQ